MRVFPVLLAVLVAALLYAVVVERDRFVALIGPAAPTEVEADQPPDIPVKADTDASETPPREGAVRVMAMKSVAQEIDSAVRLRGETEALREVAVMAETTGKVVSDPLRKGAFVDAGDTLCRLDPGTRQISLEEAEAALAEARASVPEAEARVPEAEARVAEAEAALEEARINENAASTLSGSGYASDTRVAQTRAAVRAAEAAVSSAKAGLEAARSGLESAAARIRSAEAAVARAENEIDKLTIRAPFDGLLESDTAELGALLQSGGMGGDPCATVLQLDPIKIVGFVPEAAVGRVHVGATASARLTGGREVAGEVTFVSRSADALTRTFRVEIRADNADLALSAGQTAEIAIDSDGVKAHLIPQSAMTLSDDGTLGVRAVGDDGTARFHGIEIVRDTVEGTWVTGLPDRTDIITLGQEYVTDGVPVAPSYQDIIQ
ncbi:efflux RND transporter periplasmic adaptor subunit [Roseivivax sediminis]|uniref:Membrane fusion protein, multidrug efflux system n=1 Tax=Roseivivax sediminis TaxID=936889 RepID=A0A1I1VIE2_9RHOB|nr:efflux RND transporter periplasmic adaptor subunit [Roseivivax sediminis]SFD80843.1 membrane fusion protein, multidrug efflux system [Roseivivax sediminis]